MSKASLLGKKWLWYSAAKYNWNTEKEHMMYPKLYIKTLIKITKFYMGVHMNIN